MCNGSEGSKSRSRMSVRSVAERDGTDTIGGSMYEVIVAIMNVSQVPGGQLIDGLVD